MGVGGGVGVVPHTFIQAFIQNNDLLSLLHAYVVFYVGRYNCCSLIGLKDRGGWKVRLTK